MTYKHNNGSKKDNNGKCLPLRGYYGTGMLFVIASIIFSTYLVVVGTDNRVYWALCVPQALFAAVILVYLTHNN